MDSPTGRYNEIDQLRGIAILMVVWHHICNLFTANLKLDPLFTQTWAGVDLFFVISGFVVSQSMFKLFSDHKNLKYFHLWGIFLKKRFIRILPVAWLWAFIPLLMTFIPSPTENFSTFSKMGKEFLGVVFFVYNYYSCYARLDHIRHFWSLAVEEHFYLLLPLLFFFSKNKKLLTFVCLGALGAEVIFRILLNPHPDAQSFAWIHFISHYRFDGLLVGVLLFLQRVPMREGGLRISEPLAQVFAKACLFLVIFIPGSFNRVNLVHYGYFVIALAAGGLVWLGSLDRNVLFGSGTLAKIFHFVGMRSYSMYLVNIPWAWVVLELGARGNWSSLSRVLFFIVGTFVITELNYHWVEKPFINRSRLVRVGTT